MFDRPIEASNEMTYCRNDRAHNGTDGGEGQQVDKGELRLGAALKQECRRREK